MSQEIDETMMRYYSAFECFQEAEDLFHRQEVNISKIKEKLQSCYSKISDILSTADNNCSYLEKIDKPCRCPQTKIDRSPESNKTKNEAKQELLSMVKSTIEIPRVEGLKQIAGLWEVKKMLKSFVILPKTQPQLFINKKKMNSFLLFGPPGTGKTHLIHALAYEAGAQLFCVTAGTIISPLVGQSERNIKFLFEYLKNQDSFSILFIDEVDGFCRKRCTAEQEHSRRIKTELLCQISQMETTTNFCLICATNCPWDLDSAFLRRFQKRVYIPLPNDAERCDLLRKFTKDTALEAKFSSWECLITRTDGWSGSDLSNLVQEALNVPLLELQDTKIWRNCADGFYEPVTQMDDFNLEEIHYSDLNDLPPYSVRARNVDSVDLINAFDNINMTVTKSEVQKYEEFCKQ